MDQIRLYRAPTTVADTEAVAEWLSLRVDASIEVANRFLDAVETEAMADTFAKARVLSPYKRETGNTMLGIRRYEQQAIEQPERAGGVLYDGHKLQQAFNRQLSTIQLNQPQIILIDRAIGTWGEHDGRWHKRVCVLGQPAIISVPGLYEAPAKPESYYKIKQQQALLGGSPPPREVLEEQIDGKFLVENDPRTTDTLKGYVLQAVHYLQTGEAFCSNEQCRLYNAHRQPELLTAQLESPAFCDRHADQYDT